MVCNYRTAQIYRAVFRLNVSKHNYRTFQISSYIPKHEIFQAECGSPQLAEIPLANYRTTPEYSKQNAIEYSKQNYDNIRT